MDIRVGVNERGAEGLRINRPNGSGDYVVVAFLGPAVIGPGRPQPVGVGDCIVWAPETPTSIRGDPVIINHYVHLPTTLAEVALARFPVALDTVLRPATLEFLPSILTRLRDEWARRDVHAERAIELGVEELFLHLHRHTSMRPSASPHDARLRDIRLRIQLDPTAPWTVRELARLAYLRPSRFSALYRNLFGRPPMADVLETRLEAARHYLTHYNISVAEAGARSGFADPSDFSRRFRARYGTSPRSYRAENR